MELRDLWKSLDRDEKNSFIRRSGTSEGYIEKLAGGYCCPSLEMAARLIAADERLTFEGFLLSRNRRVAAEKAKAALRRRALNAKRRRQGSH